MSEIDICSQTLCFVVVAKETYENRIWLWIMCRKCKENLHLVSGLFSRFIIPASSAAQFAPHIRLVQPLHYSRLLQPLRLHLVSGLFSRFIIPASSAAQFAPRIRLVQPLHYPGFFSRSVCISCPVCSAASSRLLQPLNLLLVSGLFSRFIIPASSAAPSATILFAIILIVAINTSSQTPQLCEHRAKHLNSAMPKPLYL